MIPGSFPLFVIMTIIMILLLLLLSLFFSLFFSLYLLFSLFLFSPSRPLLPRHCGFSPSTASFGMEPIVGWFDVSPPGPHRRRLWCQLTHDLYEEEILDPISWDLSHHMKVKWCFGSTRSVSGRSGSPVNTTLKRPNIHMAPPYRPITAQLRAAFL